MKKKQIGVLSVLSSIVVLMGFILFIIKLSPANSPDSVAPVLENPVTIEERTEPEHEIEFELKIEVPVEIEITEQETETEFLEELEEIDGTTDETSDEISEADPKSAQEILTDDEVLPDDLEQPKTKNKLNFNQTIDELIMSMTLEQKVGQMFFCAFRRDKSGKGIVEMNDEIQKVIDDYYIGGVILFSENIQGTQQVTNYIAGMQQESEIPLFIGIDEEGGRVVRTNALRVPKIPAALSIGETEEPENAYIAAQTIADYIKPLGFNVDFAPVADVFTNPDNTVIGDRAFSYDAYIAGDMVEYFSRGLLDNGILPSLKHFPGHGDTGEDSHYGLAVTEKTLAELYDCEFVPFRMGIEAGAPFVMTGHISTPEIDSGLPATFSNFLLQYILRNSLGFEGIIITDSLSMGAITNFYSSEQTAVRAILAGVDMLLMPQDFYAAYSAVINAVTFGQISEERINESVKRILTAKYKYGLI